ncbi:hypothetical protein HYALB_00010940 [Hymenoscyphus albidus]|uniref:RBR-type E3 ubiquitin transferase n=1 Tax=Hymenoscyphus albidus TaxID=595503 RepID=A0A9N9LMH6_9HELO|nr:hypothetical protein HYALB_00010940 [Hymenoscyphus albidus]
MDDDERTTELECLAAIFPEIVLDTNNSFSAFIELQVHPQNPVKVVFPAASGILPTPPQSDTSSQISTEVVAASAKENLESHNLSYLPSLQLHITLPQGYPEEKPPIFRLETSLSWLSRTYLDELEANGETMWEEAGRSVVVYGYIDFLQQVAENAFGFAEEGKTLEIPQDFKISLIDSDIRATLAAFQKETFDCGVCLDPKKGLVCHRMIDCGHVFCVQCLQDFYNNAITEGDLAFVRCLDPSCAKDREKAHDGQSKKRKVKTQLSPSELHQIPLQPEMVERYVRLRYKASLESDKNTIYCPRKWCQGAARSSKHRKPDAFDDVSSGEESEAEESREGGKKPKYTAGKDRLAVCEDCSFAFCNRCFQGWHGEFEICIPRTATGEITEEDKASLEYLKQHTAPCPTCATPAQKTHGCNHMICFICRSHFCYLCSAWLSPSNPYAHYNTEGTNCYMQLWALEEGDGEEAGRVRPDEVPGPEEEEEEAVVEVIQQHPEIEEPEDQNALGIPVDPAPQEPLQREGPLVLRINQLPPRPVPAPAPAVPDPPRGNRRHRPRGIPPALNAGVGQARRRGGGQRMRRDPRFDGDAGPIAPRGAEAAQQAWIQMFVQMALNDEEDQLDSGDDEADNDGVWEIPVR